ncbi:ABC transporter permease [Tumidithrix helvetica PCC 7403]
MLVPPVDLSLEQMSLALGLMAMTISLSFWQKLGLASNLAIATLRSVVQLTIVGYLLDAVFDIKQAWAVLFILALMSTVAAKEAKDRIGKKVPYALPIVWGSVLLGTGGILAYTLSIVVRPGVWYEPQYLIPLAGMILGNSMNGAAIAAERLTKSISQQANAIETQLCLGAKPQQAIATYQKEAIKAAMIPSINGMMVAGVVALPGMMTGQILSGVSPLLATRYQLVILFAIVAANLLTTLFLTKALSRQFFTAAQQLKLP